MPIVVDLNTKKKKEKETKTGKEKEMENVGSFTVMQPPMLYSTNLFSGYGYCSSCRHTGWSNTSSHSSSSPSGSTCPSSSPELLSLSSSSLESSSMAV